MNIAILLYEGFTALDATGPFDVFSRLPGGQTMFVSRAGGPVRADAGALQIVTRPLSAAPRPDIVVVPGGTFTNRHLGDEELLGWLRSAHASATWTTSVCTGALLLGAAGLLEGRRATSHWYELDSLAVFGAEPVSERVVRSGDVVTAAGVSAGIDMALWVLEQIAGAEHSRAVHLVMEYDPDPPQPTGSVGRAPPELVTAMHAEMRRSYGPTWAELSAKAEA